MKIKFSTNWWSGGFCFYQVTLLVTSMTKKKALDRFIFSSHERLNTNSTLYQRTKSFLKHGQQEMIDLFDYGCPLEENNKNNTK